jgi:predicted nucleotidyltransferase
MNTAKNAVSKQEIETILERYGVVDILVFGSFARGTDIQPQSDIDLLVTYKPGMTLFDIADLQGELEKALNRRVDLISGNHLSKRLAKRIVQDARPLSSIL